MFLEKILGLYARDVHNLQSNVGSGLVYTKGRLVFELGALFCFSHYCFMNHERFFYNKINALFKKGIPFPLITFF